MAKSKIYKDFLGLYTICGSYISRPIYGTQFNEDDEVNTHHFGGSTKAGVTTRDKPETHNFKKGGQYEVWTTTGTSNKQYKDKTIKLGHEGLFGASYNTWEEYLKLNTEWYTKTSFLPYVYKEMNDKFVK